MHQVYIAGDDFKSGQTKYKSVLVDFLVGAGIKPVSIVSYNHLGNNDGCNLSAPSQFRSKEISKSNVVDDMVESNQILYADGKKPDHTVSLQLIKSFLIKQADSKHFPVPKSSTFKNFTNRYLSLGCYQVRALRA